jgi:hypothetical protein
MFLTKVGPALQAGTAAMASETAATPAAASVIKVSVIWFLHSLQARDESRCRDNDAAAPTAIRVN